MNLAQVTSVRVFPVVLLCLAATAHAQGANSSRQSISSWVACGEDTDNAQGVARAFAAARHSAFTLVIDCPVRLHIGIDIDRSIFIDDGTSVEFSGAGKFIVDNVFHPAFVIANAHNVTLTNWNVEYDASLPVEMKTGGFERSGQYVPAPDRNSPPATAFTDYTLTNWLVSNRGLVFDRAHGNVGSIWKGPTNTSALFFITGDTSNLKVTGMRIYAPPAANGGRFMPMVFSLTENYKSNQRVDAATPHTPQYIAVPHDLTFSDIDIDGYYMGFQGTVQNAIFQHVRAHRSADLQDANGNNTGGVGKWFAPPHLFYFNYEYKGDPGLFNRNVQILDVIDAGPRVGDARDKGGADPGSGFAMSLKIGGDNCRVDNYKSNKPDGFIDVLPSTNLIISNVDATYDSSYLHDIYSGWRFPLGPYKGVVFKNVIFKDVAENTVAPPLTGNGDVRNDGIVFTNVRIQLNHWKGKGTVVPVFKGTGSGNDLEFNVVGDSQRMRLQ